MRGAPDPWSLDPNGDRRDGNGLSEALRLVHTAELRQPTELGRPRLSTFPMTRAARAAIAARKAAEARAEGAP